MSISKATLLSSLKIFKEFQDIANERKYVAQEANKALISNADQNKLDRLENYELPTATTERLGGVKIGDGLQMIGEVLTCTVSGGTTDLVTQSKNGLMRATDKVKLDGIDANAQENVIEIIKVDDVALPVTDKAVNIDLSAYAKTTDLSKVFHFKGSVNYYSNLPSLNQEVGDVYNIKNAGGTDAQGTEIKAGDNVVWTPNGWDVLGGNYELPIASETQLGGVKVGTGLQMKGGVLNVTLDSGEKYSEFKGATAISGGESGLVIKPNAGDQDKYLRGDGTWANANVTIIQNGSGSSTVIDTKIPAIQGALWQDFVNGDPCLKLRYNDHEYNFYYDFISTAAIVTPTLETDKGTIYTLNTNTSTLNGGLWYEVNSDTDTPILKMHYGNFNYGYKYDTITYKGGNANLVSFMPFEFSTSDACENEWDASGSPTVEINPVLGDENAFGGRALKSAGSLKSPATINDLFENVPTTPWTVDFWISIEDKSSYKTGTYPFFQMGVYKGAGVQRTSTSTFQLANGILTWKHGNKAPNANYKTVEFADLNLFGKRTHFALTSGGKGKLFINGKLVREGTNTVNNFGGAFVFSDITSFVLFTGYNTNCPMYIDHFRVHDRVVWESDFTPPAPEDYFM